MTFPFNLYLLALASAFGLAWLGLPGWRRLCLRVALIDDPGHRKIHHTPVPLAGGVAVFAALALPVAAGLIWTWLQAGPEPSRTPWLDPAGAAALQYGVGRRVWELAAIGLGATLMVGVGLLDDRYELKPAVKFAGQIAAALVVAAGGIRVTLFVPNVAASYFLTVLWILTVVNAFNFMDNMNGLCAGLGAIGAWYFGVAAAAQGQYLVAAFGFLVAGALLGFLPHNFPQARAFLGDSGSHLVGYLLAVMAILPHFYTPENERRWAVTLPLWILAVPLLDLVWVVWLRWRMGQPFYQGDNNHLSHRLVRSGRSRTTAVLLIWLLAAAAGWVGLML